MEKKTVQRGRPQMTMCGMCTVWWIPKAIGTHSEFVIILCFSAVTVVMGKRLYVKLYVHCLSS